MGKPLSLDLRERVMGFIDEGHSCNQAARVFRISISSAIRMASSMRAIPAIRLRGSFVFRSAVRSGSPGASERRVRYLLCAKAVRVAAASWSHSPGSCAHR